LYLDIAIISVNNTAGKSAIGIHICGNNRLW
jgi:hypothetical protein